MPEGDSVLPVERRKSGALSTGARIRCIHWLYCMFKLSRGIFSSDRRLFELFIMHCRVVLRDHWSDGSDGSMFCGLIFGYLSDGLFKLLIRKLCIFRIVN